MIRTGGNQQVRRRGKALNAVMLPCALALALATAMVDGAQAQPNVEELLVRVGERVAEFYRRARNVICIETSTVQAVDWNNSTMGFARTVESELRVEADSGQTLGEPVIVRKIRKVNGRAPRERDMKDRSGCTDPNPLSSEPLTFLLPAQRSKYQFRTAGTAKDRNRPVLMIDFASVNRKSNPVLIEAESGHDDCFDWSGHIAARGRIWVDAENHDVVRVERGLGGPVDVKVPVLIQRRYHIDNWVVIVRDDMTIRYRTVTFSDPEEVLLLPESIDSYHIGPRGPRVNAPKPDVLRLQALRDRRQGLGVTAALVTVPADGTGRARIGGETVSSSQNWGRTTARPRDFVCADGHPWGRRIRILRIITRLNTGGPAVYLSTLCRGLSPSRYEQWLVTGIEGPGERSMLPFVESQGIRPITLPEMIGTPNVGPATWLR